MGCMRADSDHFRSVHESLIISYSGSVKSWTQKYTQINTNKYRAVGNMLHTRCSFFVIRNLYDVSSEDDYDLVNGLYPETSIGKRF